MWPVCDHQTGTQPFLNLTEAFTSQGDLFVLGAKSPQRGDSCFHFSFQTEVHPWKRLQSPPPALSSPPAPPYLFRKGQAFQEYQPSKAYKVAVRLGISPHKKTE